jgi:hypothetical protein
VIVEPVPPPPPPAFRIFHWGGSFDLNLGVAGGGAYSGTALNDFVNERIQLETGLDAVFLEQFVVGADVGISYLLLGDTFSQGCSSDGGSCYGLDYSIGVHAEFRILPPVVPYVPWVGIGGGYDAMYLNETVGGASEGVTFGGSYFDVRAGVDMRAAGTGWGPFVGLRLGQYTSVGGENDSGYINSNVTSAVAHPTEHEWFTIGFRGRY